MAKARQKSATNTRTWEVYHLGRTGKRLGTVEAVDADQALQKAVEEFDIKPQDVSRTMVRVMG